ncbi:MAG: hypothetical protein R2762_06760 [Bryobacteraceae bacterium]
MAIRPFIFVLPLLGAVAGAQSKPVTIDFGGDPTEIRVVNSGILPRLRNPNFQAILKVSLDQDGAPALSGDYEMKGGALVFKPRYKLEPGLSYRAVYSLVNEHARGAFTVPKPKVAPSTVVERIYPTAAVLPENQLKFYLHFSAPMSRGEAAKRIHLFQEDGTEVKLPFLELDEELWDRDFRRLTVLFDPGRVKRGLVPNAEVGLPIRDGQKYRLVVDAEWQDGSGIPLKQPFVKQFSGGPAVRSAIDPKEWTITAPRGLDIAPLVIDFPRPLDAALLQRFLDVVDGAGQLVKGRILLDKEERRWLFQPDRPWQPGQYSIEVVSTLEDLAGNKVGRAFDVDVFDRVDQAVTMETVSLPFTVAAP